MAAEPDPYAGRAVVVAGAGVAGSAAARALLRRGATVTVVDRVASAATEALAGAGARIRIADGVPDGLFVAATDLVVSPGFAPHHPLPAAAAAAGLAVYSEPELAWRLRGPGDPPWLAVTGTNGKTTTVTMLAAMLRAAGLRATAVGNIGEPLVDIPGPGSPEGYDVLAVELSSQQLYWSSTLAPPVAALLNLAEDHLEWHGGFKAYVEAKTAIWRAPAGAQPAGGEESSAGAAGAWRLGGARGAEPSAGAGTWRLGGARGAEPSAGAGTWRLGGARGAEPSAGAGTSRLGGTRGAPPPAGQPPACAVGSLDDDRVARLLAAVPGRTVGFTLGEPAPGQLGLVDGVLTDHAFADRPVGLAEAELVRPPGGPNHANALAAAALARAYGVPPGAVRDGLTGYQPQPHRHSRVADVAGVTYVDDSKATNPHAAVHSLTTYPRVVWIAGGQLKGVAVSDLVAAVAARLVGVVLLGVDRGELARALARHAPGVPVVEVSSTDDGAMREVVAAATRLAAPGDTVLLAPAAASRDMFISYAHRGEAFAAAVAGLAAGSRRVG